MASIVDLIKPQIAFDPESITVLSAALEEAWARLLQSGSECTRPAYARAMREVIARRIIDMAQRGTKDKKELVEGAVRFLLRTIDLKRKVGKFLRKRLSRRRGFLRFRLAADKVPRCRNGLLEVLHPRENIDWRIWLRNKKAARRQIAPAWGRDAGNDDQMDRRPSVSDCGRQPEPVH
jgi:hypothetical protein